ncbi:MAG TPA: Rne/Rng family ribonuclease [Candidatus Methylomirabilis sp.]|nr:Rne/Rng family ribonuclease [Candidatus Methylomirabilis sp.]
MNKELYVSSTPHETRVALVEDDQLAEVFYERENEYTLAGSVYKGRVTRVLPGMQSAFVDIGLERDAFLYVSDFLELTDDEDSEEFGDIPAPQVTVNLNQSAELAVEPATGTAETETDEESEFVAAVEDLAATDERGGAEPTEDAAGAEDSREGGGARRWRGRRRRGGRRGGRDERFQRPEARTEAVEPAAEREVVEPEPESRPAPPRYAPIVLPGESISKYRNIAPAAPEAVTEETAAETAESAVLAPVEDFLPPAAPAVSQEEVYEEVEEETEEAIAAPVAGAETLATAPEVAAEQREVEKVSAVATEAPFAQAGSVSQETHAEVEVAEVARPAEAASNEQVEATEFGSIEAASEPRPAEVHETEAGHPEAEETVRGQASFQHHTAPVEAPAGRTLEHETLEDDEMEFHPMPENLEALSEVAGDLDLELEEQTLDDDNGYSDRWIPKIADVDEDEVVAAEERGETHLPGGNGDYEEEENGEEETNGRAELRAASPTAAYQQRQQRRGGDFDRRGQRGYRGRRNNVRTYAHRPTPLISDLLKEGQEILIQIAKEPIAKKGARITSHIALPGRFLVYMPTVNHTGVSRKINSEEERQRLKRIVTSERENGLGGFIVRTAAANIKEDELRADIRFLKHLWAEIKNRADSSKSPALIYHDLNLVERVLRDQVNADFSQIWVDTEEEYERVIRFAQRFQPSLVRRIKLYTKSTPLYENFGIQDEINNALKSKVWLKSGGYIVINQTEALVAIDINTGKYVGKTQRLEDTIVKTNIEAVKEIVRQVRLRDLGGIIVIDFIDMDERKNRQKVMQALEEALRTDRAPSKALQFNDFGLVAITRKRVKQSLERSLGEACPYCTGAGFVKSATTVCNEIYIEMRKMIKAHDRTDVTLRVNPEIAKALKAGNGKLITEMEEMVGKPVLVKSDAMLHQENFDIQ